MKRKERDLGSRVSLSILRGTILLTLTTLTSNLTPIVLLPMLAKKSLSTSAVGNGLVSPGDSDVDTAKSLGIGGRFLLLFDNVECAVGE
jgi:hypothetical protein